MKICHAYGTCNHLSHTHTHTHTHTRKYKHTLYRIIFSFQYFKKEDHTARLTETVEETAVWRISWGSKNQTAFLPETTTV